MAWSFFGGIFCCFMGTVLTIPNCPYGYLAVDGKCFKLLDDDAKYCTEPIDGKHWIFPCGNTWVWCNLWCDGWNHCPTTSNPNVTGAVIEHGAISLDELHCDQFQSWFDAQTFPALVTTKEPNIFNDAPCNVDSFLDTGVTGEIQVCRGLLKNEQDYCTVPVDGELRFPCFDTWAPCTLWCDGTNQCGYENEDHGRVSRIGITSLDERYCNHETQNITSFDNTTSEPSTMIIPGSELQCDNETVEGLWWPDYKDCWKIPDNEQDFCKNSFVDDYNDTWWFFWCNGTWAHCSVWCDGYNSCDGWPLGPVKDLPANAILGVDERHCDHYQEWRRNKTGKTTPPPTTTQTSAIRRTKPMDCLGNECESHGQPELKIVMIKGGETRVELANWKNPSIILIIACSCMMVSAALIIVVKRKNKSSPTNILPHVEKPLLLI